MPGKQKTNETNTNDTNTNDIKAVNEIWGVIKSDLLRILSNVTNDTENNLDENEKHLGEWLEKICSASIKEFSDTPDGDDRLAVEAKIKKAINFCICTFDTGITLSTKLTGVEAQFRFTFSDAAFTIYGYKTPVIKMERDSIYEISSFLSLEINHTMLKIMFISIVAEILSSAVVAAAVLNKLAAAKKALEEHLKETPEKQDKEDENKAEDTDTPEDGSLPEFSPEDAVKPELKILKTPEEDAAARTIIEATMTSRIDSDEDPDIEKGFTASDIERLARLEFNDEEPYTDEDAKQDIVDAVMELCKIETYDKCKLHIKGIKSGKSTLHVVAEIDYDGVEYEGGVTI